jgi:hypothetical protein
MYLTRPLPNYPINARRHSCGIVDDIIIILSQSTLAKGSAVIFTLVRTGRSMRVIHRLDARVRCA